MALTRLPSFTVDSTSSFTFANVTVTSNVSANNANLGNLAYANYFSGDGSLLRNLPGANITGTTANANFALYSGTVTTSAQPNITSVGTLTDLGVSGNITVGGNFTVNGTLTSINSTIVEIDDLALVLANDASTSSQANGAGIIINGASANMLYIDSSNSFTFSHRISADGGLLSNVTGANVTGYVANATHATIADTSNAVAGANVTGTVANATHASQSDNANIAGTVTTNAQPNITSVGTLSSLAVTGNLTAGNINGGNLVYATYVSGNGSLLTALTGANVTGIVGNATHATIADGANNVSGGNVTGQVANALVAGTVYTNAQPNITSLGTLTSVTVSGDSNISNLNVTGNVYKATGNLSITAASGRIVLDGQSWPDIDGSSGQLLSTDGTGNLAWIAPPATYGDSNVANYLPTFTGNLTAGNISISGNINDTSGNLTISTVTDGNIFLVATGNGRVSIDGLKWPTIDGVTGQVLVTDGAGNLSWADGGTGGGGGGGSTANALFFTDTFTGDGTTTDFTVRSTLASKDQITVIYDGAVIMKSDYTLVGNLISFSSAPEDGSLLEISGIGLQNAVLTTGVANVVTDSSQPNITQVGSLVSLESIGTVDFGNASTVYLPAVSDITMGGGNAGQYLTTDGTGNISWSNLANVAQTSDTAPVNPGAGALWLNTLTGDLSVYYGGWVIIGGGVSISIPYFSGANVVGNVNSAIYANYSNFAGTVTTAAQPNITSVGTLTNVVIFGNTQSGNITSTGYVAAANGYVASNAFSGTLTDGVVVDFSNGNGRISTSANDGINFYSNGVANSFIFGLSTTGNANVPNSLNVVANTQTSNLSVTTSATVSGWLTTQQSTELFVPITGATGTVAHNLTLGATFYHTGVAGSFVVNFTNVPTTDARITVVSLIINQGSTAYLPTVQIDGVAQTVKWLAAAAPAASVNKIDILTYSLIRSGSTWAVLGQLATYA